MAFSFQPGTSFPGRLKTETYHIQVERYEHESSQQYHLSNPYWKTFDPYVLPLLDGPMDLRRFEELDTSQVVKVD